MAPEIIAQSAASHSNHFNQIEFLHSTGWLGVTTRATRIVLWLLSNPLDDGTCAGETDGALRIVNAALRDREATSAGATFGVELLHRLEPSLGR